MHSATFSGEEWLDERGDHYTARCCLVLKSRLTKAKAETEINTKRRGNI